jgi:hypothetical protein
MSSFKKIKGKIREEHFESGGTPATWLGLHHVHKPKKKNRAEKKKNAIKESEE